MMTKIAIVDDHALYRLGIRAAIEDNLSDCEIVGDYCSGQELLVRLEKGNCIPDLIILDIVMPDMSGIEIARYLRVQYPEIRVMMLSSDSTPENVEKLLAIGVNGYLNKEVAENVLISAIQSIIKGEPYYGKCISKIMYDAYISKENSKKGKDSLPEKNEETIKLTEREKDVIKLLCKGKSVKEIAFKLNVSPRTIDSHKANILQKLGFQNTIELVKYAVRKGLV